MHTVAKERMSSVEMITGILSLALLFLVPTITAHVHEASSDLNAVLPNPIREVTDMDGEGVIDDLRRGLLNAEAHFAHFVKKFNKEYSGAEEHARRFSIFKKNLHKALRHQKLDRDAIHGINKFSDLTEEEFHEQYLGLSTPPRSLSQRTQPAPILPTDDLPPDFDWRELGAVTPVKNQGACGSCWTFSTTGAMEGANFMKTGKLISLSEQQLVDCDHECDSSEPDVCDSGCNGGLMTTAYQYALKAGGLQREEDYPYTGIDGSCKFDNTKVAAMVANFSTVSIDEDQIAANLVKNGPLAVGINAAFMQTYVGGVSCPYVCNKQNLDHGVLLVGYGAAGYAPGRLKNKPFWIIKNSWGPDWGEDGYYKLCRGHNVCGINTMVSTVAAANIQTDDH
jgi:cathepsin F